MAGGVTQATDPLGRLWRYEYDGGGRLASVTDPLNGVVRYQYDSLNQLTSITDRRGVLMKQLTYDGNGRVIAQKFAESGVERYAYELSGALVTSTSITNTLGFTRTLRYNGSGYVVETQDRFGQTGRINRDINTNTALSTVGSCGCSEATRQFDERGNVTSITDLAGRTARLEYDSTFNRLTKLTDKSGRNVSFVYDSFGQLLTTTDALVSHVRRFKD